MVYVNKLKLFLPEANWRRGSSVIIVFDYGPDDRGSILGRGKKDFSSILCVQTGSGAHPSSCSRDIGVLSPGLKRGRGVKLTTQPF
jgi:hypothetical protein